MSSPVKEFGDAKKESNTFIYRLPMLVKKRGVMCITRDWRKTENSLCYVQAKGTRNSDYTDATFSRRCSDCADGVAVY